MEKDTRSRKWQITINNPVDKGFTHDKLKELLGSYTGIKYWCMCDEIGGKTSTYHTHIFIYVPNTIRFSSIKNKFEGAHIEMARGTCEQNYQYIRKEGKWEKDAKKETNLIDTFEDWGEMPIERQGARNDIEDMYAMIKQGMTISEIIEEDPNLCTRIDTIKKARSVYLQGLYKNKRRLDLEVHYVCGKTGKGKTRSIMDKYGDENVYRVTNYKNPFDMYECQKVIVFEEFRSSIMISDMLNYLDVYPLSLPARFTDQVACYNVVYIVTNWELEMQYSNVQSTDKETWNAFLRRINDVTVKDDTTKYYESIEKYFNRNRDFVKIEELSECEQMEIPFVM